MGELCLTGLCCCSWQTRAEGAASSVTTRAPAAFGWPCPALLSTILPGQLRSHPQPGTGRFAQAELEMLAVITPESSGSSTNLDGSAPPWWILPRDLSSLLCASSSAPGMSLRDELGALPVLGPAPVSAPLYCAQQDGSLHVLGGQDVAMGQG